MCLDCNCRNVIGCPCLECCGCAMTRIVMDSMEEYGKTINRWDNTYRGTVDMLKKDYPNEFQLSSNFQIIRLIKRLVAYEKTGNSQIENRPHPMTCGKSGCGCNYGEYNHESYGT